MLQLKPYDLLIFGDGKPFNASQQNFRQGRFFLNPIPIVSAVNKILTFKENSEFSESSIEFLAFKKNGEVFFKTPADILKVKNTDEIKFPKLKELEGEFCSNLDQDIEYILDYEEERKTESISEYMSFKALLSYLKNEDKDNNKNDKEKQNDEITFAKLYDVESRVGIALDRKTRNTKEGFLYFQDFIRFKEDVSLVVKLKNDKYKEKIKSIEFLTLGGESKISIVDEDIDYREEFEKEKNEIMEKINETGFFKIVLLTPTNAIPKIEGAKLILQVSYPVINYSSWINIYKDKRDKYPSRMFKIIPEGSVFYYKLEDKNNLGEIFNKYWLKPSFFVNEYPFFDKNFPIGFGLSIISAVNLEGKNE